METVSSTRLDSAQKWLSWMKSPHESTGVPATARMRSPGRSPASAAHESGSTSPTTAPSNRSAFGTGGGSAQTRRARTTAKTRLQNGPANATIARFHQTAGGIGASFFPAVAGSALPWSRSMPAGSSWGSAT